MIEDRLLSDSVRLFSERYPDKRGQLFHVSNERNNQRQAMMAKAKGIFNGISDLLFFDEMPRITGGIYASKLGILLIGIELKVQGSKHDKQTVLNQVSWGETLEAQGGVWRLCMSAEDAVSCTELNFKGLTTSDVRKLLESTTTQTITFK